MRHNVKYLDTMPSQKCVLSLSDDIFALHAPIVVTMDARSTAILTIELASDRSADTWRAPCEALENHHCFSLGMASDRGLGLVAGYGAACDMALWVGEYVHELRDLGALLRVAARCCAPAVSATGALTYSANMRFIEMSTPAALTLRCANALRSTAIVQ